MVNNTKHYLILLSTLLLLGGCVSQSANSPALKTTTMMTNDPTKTTHCLGRYLLDLPTDTTIKAGYEYANAKVVTRQNVSENMFNKIVNNREAELKSKQLDRGGSWLIDKQVLSPERIHMTAWTNQYGRYSVLNENFVHIPEHNIMYTRAGKGDDEKIPEHIKLNDDVLTEYRYRAEGEIPTGVGFCFENGFFASNLPAEEEVSAGFFFPKHPNMTFSLTTFLTGNPDRPLLDRNSGLMGQLFGLLTGSGNIIRKGQHNIGPLEGQELLVRVKDEQGEMQYQFVWESQGKKNSIEFPFISFSLRTGVEWKGPKAIQSDEEALELWDSVLNSLRLRPGAV